jgi:TonB family protein
MKNAILYMTTLLLFISCATAPLEISENDEKLRMIGGKEALLEAIEYPEFALTKGIEDIVTVLAYVDTLGSVIECKIVDGNEFLNDAAITALKKQRFYPYIIQGKKRPVRVAIPISFTISKDINVAEFEAERIKYFAEQYMNEPIQTLNLFSSRRSPGSKNEYYSEALTWWPKQENPYLPYMIKEGVINPDAFTKHKVLLERLGKIVPGLTSAYLITNNKEYAKRALDHIYAWFIDPETSMAPNLNYAQAIPYRTSGRAVGILEGLPLVEVIQSLQYLDDFLSENEKNIIDLWLEDYENFLEFGDYSEYLMQRKDNYSTAWLVQLSMIAKYLDNDELMANALNYFLQHTLSFTLDEGSFYLNDNVNRKLEYNIFYMSDMLAIESEILKQYDPEIWEGRFYYGRRVGDLINYEYSGILNNDLKTVGYYNGRFLSLLLAGKAYDNPRYLELWRDLNAGEFKEGNFPVRQPVLWIK